ncbi:MAG: hypothetical protein HOV78_28655 [Hamadaea sp.]|nr:hypothetical protein [Hamadaea sp.]NUT02206.1 hypothetical protein [Hamadaea sp.]
MSESFQVVVDVEATALDAAGLARAVPEDAFPDAEIVAEPTVFDAGLGSGPPICPLCGETGEVQFSSYLEAVESWWDGDVVDPACVVCGQYVGLNDWDWPGSPWAVGNFGLRFWNRPRLTPAEVAAIGDRLGHRVVLVYGRG